MRLLGIEMAIGIDVGCIGNNSMEQWGVSSSCGGGGGGGPPAWLLQPEEEEDPQLPESVGRGGSGGFVGVRGSSGLGKVSEAIFATAEILAASGASFWVTTGPLTRQLFKGAE